MKTLLPRVAATALCVALAGCSAGAGEQVELSRAQKDSIVADLPVPGASGVGSAMQARDRANARAAEHDSIAR